MRYYIIAGERSGDLHGSNLVKALRALDGAAVFRGFGGEYMQEAGVALAVHYNEIVIMGLVEFLFSLVKMTGYIRRCKADIDAFKPDVIILIDYGGFNRRIAKYGKRKGIRVFYYIPPKIWAWYQRRAYEIKANVDRLFVILPFEKEFYRKFDWEVDYVGNPVLDAVRQHQPDSTFLQRYGLRDKPFLVAFLPGSRQQEVLRILPVMAEVAAANPHLHFLLAGVENLDQSLYEPVSQLPNVTRVTEQTYDVLANARAAVVTSGTATLETAVFNVPQVVVYKASPMSFWLAKKLIRVNYISLVNLIAGREVVKECIQDEANEASISAELARISDGSARETMLADYAQLMKTLDTGTSASARTAQLMWGYLNDGG